MRADRLLQIVSLLRQHGQLSAGELARRLEVAPRTVLRDMEALSTAGVPIYAERGRRGGFALVPGYRPALEELTADEVQALLLSGTGALGPLGMGDQLASALRKLTGTVSPEQGRLADRVGERIVVDDAGWYREPEAMPHFAAVQRAVLGDRRLRLRYRPKDPSRVGIRTVDPYGLLQAGGVWYLAAAHRGEPRTYRVSRMLSATVLDSPCARPPDLDLRALWQQLRSAFARPPDRAIRLRVKDSWLPQVRFLLGNQGAGPFRITAVSPGVSEVTVDVHALRPTVGVLAGLGDGVVALDPPELVELMIAVLDEGRAAYPGSAAGQQTVE